MRRVLASIEYDYERMKIMRCWQIIYDILWWQITIVSVFIRTIIWSCHLLISFVCGLLCVTETNSICDEHICFRLAKSFFMCKIGKLCFPKEKKNFSRLTIENSCSLHTHTRSNKYFFNWTHSYANRVRDINKCNEIQFRCEFQLFCSVAWMRFYAANSIFRYQLCSPRHTISLSARHSVYPHKVQVVASCHLPITQ